MNLNPLIRDVGRALISFAVVGTWLYCELMHDVCAFALKPYALTVLAAWLGIEGVLKVIEGVQTGKYTNKE